MTATRRDFSRLSPERLTAFSDGVIAVIVTIMVLDLKVPARDAVHGDFEALRENMKLVLLYGLSFVQVGIYWVNHHYLLDDAETVTHGALWANLLWLFLLSLFPFATSWLGVRGVNGFSMTIYSVVSILPALAWVPLARLVRTPEQPPVNDPRKEYASIFLYAASIAVSGFWPSAAIALLCVAAVLWLMPPTRVIHQRHTR